MDINDVDRLRAAVDTLEGPLRRAGVFFETTLMADANGRPALIIQAMVGDTAFSTRVQDPGQATADTVLLQMEHEEKKTEFDRTREDLLHRIEKGEPLFDDPGSGAGV